jgi:DnaJ-class molecular chaperone
MNLVLRNYFSTKKSNNLNYYNVLNVPFNATQNQIKSQYYQQCKNFHPDSQISQNKLNFNNQINNTSFFQLNEAYNILKDPKKRSEYDKSLMKRNFIAQVSSHNFNNSNLRVNLKFWNSVQNQLGFKMARMKLTKEESIKIKDEEKKSTIIKFLVVFGVVISTILFSDES